MRKVQILVGALFAVFAVSAVAATMASAETTPKWLVDGAAITELLSVETIGELLLTALNEPIIGTVEVLCSGILDGTISPENLDEVTELLTLAGAAISLTALTEPGLACTDDKTNCPEPLVWAIGLPYTSELLSVTDDVTKGAEVGFTVNCMLVIGSPEDTCFQTEVLATLEAMVEPIDLLANTNEKETATCRVAGAGPGSIESDAPALIQVLEGLTLTVS